MFLAIVVCVLQLFQFCLTTTYCRMLVTRHGVWAGNWISWTLMTGNNK